MPDRGVRAARTRHEPRERDDRRGPLEAGVRCIVVMSKTEMLALDVEARLDLIEELWDSIASDSASAGTLPLTDEERALLDERLREHRAHPDAPRPWAEVR